MQEIYLILSLIFGAIVGSFLNVVILRLPKGMTLFGRSICPVCQQTLKAWDLIPVFSFLWLGGRCRFCRSAISKRYLLIELTTALLFALSCNFIRPVDLTTILLLIKFWLAISCLFAVFVIDLEHFLILDQIIFPCSVAMLALNLAIDFASHQSIWTWNSHLVSGLLAALFICALFFGVWYFSKGAWMGFGDVKLVIFLGLTLGWPLILMGFGSAVILGGFFSALLLVFGGKSLKTQIPFGTFLSLGTIAALFWGGQLLRWYLAILGF